MESKKKRETMLLTFWLEKKAATSKEVATLKEYMVKKPNCSSCLKKTPQNKHEVKQSRC